MGNLKFFVMYYLTKGKLNLKHKNIDILDKTYIYE